MGARIFARVEKLRRARLLRLGLTGRCWRARFSATRPAQQRKPGARRQDLASITGQGGEAAPALLTVPIRAEALLKSRLTGPGQVDILLFGPGWWGIGCYSINYIDAKSSRCSAARRRGRS